MKLNIHNGEDVNWFSIQSCGRINPLFHGVGCCTTKWIGSTDCMHLSNLDIESYEHVQPDYAL